MKIPVFEGFCGNCGQSRVVALNGSKAPERCPGCGSPQLFKIQFIEPENLATASITKRIGPVLERKAQKVTESFVLPKAKVIKLPKGAKRIMQVRGITSVDLQGIGSAVGCYCENDDGDLQVVCCLSANELEQKDIRLGDWVEVEGNKILRVLLEMRGGNNAEKKS